MLGNDENVTGVSSHSGGVEQSRDVLLAADDVISLPSAVTDSLRGGKHNESQNASNRQRANQGKAEASP